MRRFIVDRTDGQTDRIEADYYVIEDGIIYFVEGIEKEGESLASFIRPSDCEFSYIRSNVVRIVNLGEVKEEESEEPERRKNDNEDLISRSGLLNFLTTHWSSNVVEVIKTFEKAEYLD